MKRGKSAENQYKNRTKRNPIKSVSSSYRLASIPTHHIDSIIIDSTRRRSDRNTNRTLYWTAHAMIGLDDDPCVRVLFLLFSSLLSFF